MLGLDSNILLRHLLNDDPSQSPAASRFIATRCSRQTPGFINLMVLVETLWTLRRGYRYGRAEVSRVVAALLETAELVIENAEVVAWALSKSDELAMDLPDLLIVMHNESLGCSRTISFDDALIESGLADHPAK
jgi:predicted nucleic-acid-binding protein